MHVYCVHMTLARSIGLSLIFCAFAGISTPAFAESATTFTYDETRLTMLFDAYVKKHQSDAYLEKRIIDERTKVRSQADQEVQSIVAPASSVDTSDKTALPKALDSQKSIISSLQERQKEHKVDLSLLKDEENTYYTSTGSSAGPSDTYRLTTSYPQLLAKRAILEERIGAIADALPLQQARLSGLQRAQLFDQFAFLFSGLSYVWIILIGVIIDRVMRRMIVGRIEEKGRRYLIAKFLTAAIYVITVLWILSKLFSDHPNALASLAIVGAGIAVALQDVVKDVVGWMIILQRRLFTLGDRISIGEHTGDVIDVSLLRTTMLEVSVAGLFNAHERTGKTLYVPNSLLLKESLLNYNTTSDFMSVEMQVTISYESDWKKAETILKETLNAETAEFTETARRQQRRRTALFYTAWEVSSPEVHVDLAPSGILFTLKFTVPIGKRRTVVTNLSRAILERFGAEYDVNLAFNTIRIIGEKPNPTTASKK